MVLIWDAIKAIDKSSDRKLDERWRGPYKVNEAWPDKGYYRLEDLNGVVFPSTTRADRLKKFEELPRTVEAEVLAGRLRMYPESEGFRMITPLPRAGPQPQGSTPPPVDRVEAELSQPTVTEQPERNRTILKGWVTAGSYVPDRTSNNAPRRAIDEVSGENILRVSRRGELIQESDEDSE